MGRNRLQRPTFALGDFVFAKLHGYRPWPARVLGRHGSHSKLKYSVFFYGTCNTAKVSPSNILDFAQNKRRLGALRSRNTARNADFRGAMAHMRVAFARPANDFVYYQVLARMEGEGESSVTYEMLTSTTETESDYNEADSGDSTNMAQTLKSTATEQDSEKGKTESTSEEDEAPQPAKRTKISMPLLDEQDDYQANAMEKEPEQLDGDKDLFSDADSDSFELEGNPFVGSAHMKDFEDQDNAEPISRTLEELLKKLSEEDENSELDGNNDGEAEQDPGEPISHILKELLMKLKEDSDLEGTDDEDDENDQPINLCCRHITGDEQ